MTQPTSQRRNWLTRALLPLALFVATANADCIALTNSKACPGFSTLQVDTKAIAALNEQGLGYHLNNFKTVEEFDAAINASGGFYYNADSCKTTQRIRYQNTILCAMVLDNADSRKCSSSSNGPTMCRTTCTDYATSYGQMVNASCPKDDISRGYTKTLEGICTGGKGFSFLASTDNATCVNGIKNEPTTCGFDSTPSMCTFCAANPTDACCTANAAAACTPVTTAPTATTTAGVITPPASPTASNPATNGDKKDGVISGLTTAALGGIIGGGVVLILMLFAFIVCCIRRKRNNNNNHNKVGNNVHGHHQGSGGGNNLSRHMSNSSASKYKISSPKLQEEGFSTGAVPSAPIPMTALPSMNAQPAAVAAVTAGAAINRISKASSIGAGGDAGGKQYCQALYPYQASMADELDLSPGDIVNVHKVFDDGWAVGVNMNTSNEGAFPVVCVMFVDEAALHDDFEDVNMHSMTPMGLREDDNSKSSPRSSMPSRSSSPVHLPRRQSSMIRDSVVIPGLSNGGRSSPLAGSPLAGGNLPGSKLQPPVRDTMMSDASSINRWWDGESK
ncbi:hypothetical protein BGZ95_005049 [Linnemannia exigua]|uniref:SH3 domain-containing protein n=1 Tax=Linnemannia exigua TaxID=604196 RepID=A0AAD4H1D0_9FUNG|nr:hypothetical protein BGZ95_005049 [Linnemannia exigua]